MKSFKSKHSRIIHDFVDLFCNTISILILYQRIGKFLTPFHRRMEIWHPASRHLKLVTLKISLRYLKEQNM